MKQIISKGMPKIQPTIKGKKVPKSVLASIAFLITAVISLSLVSKFVGVVIAAIILIVLTVFSVVRLFHFFAVELND